MENKEIELLKSIRLTLDYCDENGVESKKDFTVKVNTPTLKDKSDNVFYKKPTVYTLTFSLTLPDHIHSYLLGKTVAAGGLSRKAETKDYPSDFIKTVKSITIEGLTTEWSQIITDYKWLKDIEKMPLQKVIFYSFDNASYDNNSRWNGIKLGKNVHLNFKYAIGYIIIDKQQRYNQDKKSISTSQDREFYNNYKHVNWTEEREEFFNNIQKTYDGIIEKISTFEENLTEDTINAFINSKSNNLLN